MKRATIGENKEHYKSYKAGKHWLYASITLLALGLGTATVETTVHADVTPAADSSSLVQKQSSVAASSSVQSSATRSTSSATTSQTPQTSDKQAPVTATSKAQATLTTTETPANDGQDVTDNPVHSDQPVGQPETTTQNNTRLANKQNAVVNDADINDTTSDVSNAVSHSAPITTDGDKAAVVESASVLDPNNAQVWMPDANLRAYIEDCIQKTYSWTTVNDANLYQYLNDNYIVQMIQPAATDDVGMITSLKGLERITNLVHFQMDMRYFDPSAMIDLSFAPNLTSFELSNLTGVPVNWGMTANDLVQKYLHANTKLNFFRADDQNLTGGIPDFSNNPEVANIYMVDNQLTGTIPSLRYLTNLENIDVSYNQLTGNIENLNQPGLKYISVQYNQLSGPITEFGDSLIEASLNNNQFTGQLPDLKNIKRLWLQNNQFSGELPNTQKLKNLLYFYNNFTSGILSNNSDTYQGYNGWKQSIQGNDVILTDDNMTFEPSAVINGLQDLTTGKNQPTKFDMENFKFDNLTSSVMRITNVNGKNIAEDAANTFKITQDANGVYQFTGNKDVKSGTYLIYLLAQDATYSTYVYINVDNQMTKTAPTEPVDPGTPVDPATPSNPDTPVVPETPTTPNPIVNGGDGDAIVPNKNETDKVTKSVKQLAVHQNGQAAKGQKSATIALNTKAEGQKVVQTAAKSPVTKADKTMTTSEKMATETLPQTNEKSTMSSFVAGVLVLLTTLGFADARRRH
ncbi:KxYKxGKxW signal peptide domain-containing protein [Levilactobacillus brevis]|uniref:KxYKxGKxW signal peptide domain-containing protein n=1 Tax=Levilactobacillus brevis TaxID=1580 RepID=UPI000A208647|nr:KxYKxGKxW signal peptide domain-containing protein [Levilactobacillus brevis]ARN89599.1 hypothetical protein AZI09_03120 [Levilactobacillus brevis]ARN97175.1 hypothetical protein AZI10_03090 [Levilactobacillus brevis]HJD99428.1 KxYKxGKxW signal peptide domain-containing protein [Levilactobacillus brevis]